MTFSLISHQYIGRKESEIYLCSYTVNEKGPNLLIVPPLGWYSVGPNRIFSRLSGLLNDIGVNVFVLDYLGQGESKRSCKEIAMEDLEYSFNTVLEYVKSLGRDIYCLGHGIGNHFLISMKEKNMIKGFIFYTPEYYRTYAYTDVFCEEEIQESREKGYFTVRQDRTIRQRYWNGLVGMYQDVFYNPISYNIVSKFKSIPLKDKLPDIKVPVLIISDRNILEKNDNVTVLYVRELEKNILPSDWDENVWPFILDEINDAIKQWIKAQIQSKGDSIGETGTKVAAKAFSEMVNKNGIRRILFYYSSHDQSNLGVIHLPVRMSPRTPCIILVTGLGGDKLESHMCGPRLGDYLAQRGYALVRYDSRFSGTSTRCLSHCTISGLKEDFEALIRHLRSNYGGFIDTDKFIIIGWSEGAKVALLNAENLIGACFWNAVIAENEIVGVKSSDIQTNLRSFVRHKMTKRLVKSIHNAGELVGLDYIIDNKKVDYFSLLQHANIPIKLIWSKSEVNKANHRLLKKYVMDETIVDAEHHLFNYEIMDDIFEITFKWVEKILEIKE